MSYRRLLLAALGFCVLWTLPVFSQLRFHGSLPLHVSRISDLAFDAAGSLYSSSWDGTVAKHEIPDGTLVWSHRPHFGDVIAMDLDPARGLLATGGLDSRVLLRDRSEFRLLGRHDGPVRAVALSAGNALASFSDNGDGVLWDIGGDAAPIATIRLSGHPIAAASLRPTSDGRHQFVVIERGGRLLRFVFDGNEPPVVREFDSPARSIELSDDGGTIAVSTVDGFVVLLSPELTQQGRFRASTGSIYSMSFLDSRRLIVGDVHGRVLIWSLIDGGLLDLLEDRPVPATAVAKSNEWLAVGFADGQVFLWRVGP